MFNRHYIISNAVWTVVYTAVAYSSLKLFATLNASASPVWPPTGLALAALLIWGPRLWPGVAIGAFAANFLTTGNLATSGAIAVGNTLEALVGSILVLHLAGGVRTFDHVRGLGIFALAAGFAAVISATIGVTSLALLGLAHWNVYGSVWITWWLGDASGALVVTPLIISFLRRQEPVPLGSLRELALLILTICVTGALVFAPVVFSTVPAVPLTFAVVPIIIWAGLRFGFRGATGSTFLFSSIAVLGTLEKLGPYGGGSINTALLSLQFTIMVLASVGLVLGAVVHERLNAQEEARKALAAEHRFETLLDSAPDAMIIADSQDKIVQVNAQTELMFGYTRAELSGLILKDLIPHRFETVDNEKTAEVQTSPPRRIGASNEVFGIKKDRTEFPVEISLNQLQTDSGLLILISIRDVSDRRRAQEERDRLAAIVESSSDAIIKETLDGTIVSWNKGAERMFGYSAKEAIGQSSGILSPTGENGKSEFLDRLIREGSVRPYETRLSRKDGATVEVLLSVTPIRDPRGSTIGASVLVQDSGKRSGRVPVGK